ncbi:MAG: hypothetical protein ACI84K_001358 [Pseudohongiellaceae bacterium]|jgi:hypothetical protein
MGCSGSEYTKIHDALITKTAEGTGSFYEFLIRIIMKQLLYLKMLTKKVNILKLWFEKIQTKVKSTSKNWK